MMRSFRHIKHFRAFTLLELLVGMIVSGIVLAATFSAFHIVSSQYASFNSKAETTAGISFFLSQMESDFSGADQVYRESENEIRITSSSKTLDYKFLPKYVLRNNQVETDTFFVPVPEIKTLHRNEMVTDDDAKIDEMDIVLLLDGKKESKIFIQPGCAKSEMDAVEQDLK